MAEYHQGKFVPINPNKYKGNFNEIYYRSSWEKKFMIWADKCPDVLEWNSEEIVIPYRCGTDNRIHRYFLDFWVKVKSKSGEIKTYLVEIKPEAQTKPPNPQKRKTKRYLSEVHTFIKNQSKWKYATEYAKDRGMEFMILTEKHLF